MQLTKVTWYSKLVAMIIFIALPFIAFFLGMKYQERLYPLTITVIYSEEKK